MKSRYVALAEVQMAAASSSVERARIETRIAAYLARQGERHAAVEIATRLREQFSQSPDAEVSASLHLVEALLDFFGDLNSAASAKMSRALALASAARIARVESLASAWLAHFAFSTHRLQSMRECLDRSFASAAADDYDALCRSASVCAVAAHLAGDLQRARRWYGAARKHALEVGDDATLSSRMHNFVAMAAMNLRQSVLTGVGSGREEFDLLLSEAQSASNYDDLIGAASLDMLLPTLRAYVHSLRDEPEQALALYGVEARAARAQGMERMAPWFLADMAWCHLKLGHNDESRDLANEAETLLSSAQGVQVDDAAAAQSRLAAVFAEFGDSARSLKHEVTALEGWSRFQSLQVELLDIVNCVEVRFGEVAFSNR